MTVFAPVLPAAPELSPVEGEGAFRLMQAAAAAAARESADAAVEFACVLAGHPARFRVVGRRWGSIIAAAFAHLPRPGLDTEAELVVELAEQSAAGFGEPPRELDELLLPGARDSTMASTDGRWVLYRRNAMLMCLDRSLGRIVGWSQAADRLSLAEQGRPLDGPLFLWLLDRGIRKVHAGLIAAQGRGILVAGKSGSGKTTTVLSCLLEGFEFVSDDHVGIEARQDGGYAGHGINASADLDANDAGRFPLLLEHAIEGTLPEEDKLLIRLSAACPERLRPAAGVDLLLLPRVTGSSRQALHPARKNEALLRLASSSLWMPHHPREEGLQSLVALVERVPAYWLELGGRTDSIAPALRTLLREVFPTQPGAQPC